MSFITKRERVFNEYDLYDLPARNEGKLKAYSSCTDARAWSHFCSDKSEHLVDIIKRNNERCRAKYVPTEAIVNTLLAHKHAEIARLKRKIEEFEQMLAAYDELELTCDQKCEIAKAHAAIREANKDLNEIWFDLDLSGFTGVDSEDYETGKSRGDEPSRYKEDDVEGTGVETARSKGDEWSYEKEQPQKVSQGNQSDGLCCPCDASTNAVDPRLEELQDAIIARDAKLNAMKNTAAVMENDVCQPYCIYAHIYTALEKIFGILCQNDKYKMYLNLMTRGKDMRSVDITGKILFKLKVLEKFSLALIAPCSQDLYQTTHKRQVDECDCYCAQIETRVETTYALTSSEIEPPCLDDKRAHLVADIMENDEMKEILDKESASAKADFETDNDVIIESYNIDRENLKRLKNLQENYDDLMKCYEALKHEKECLQIRCQKYEELQKEFENLQTQLREYNTLWNEKEHYRKRSSELDELKEQYLVLCDETTNLETKLKAESEINDLKTKTIEELRNENLDLEKRLNEASILFEKESNCARCKLKESECTIMCQGQQIKSLSLQIDRLLEQDSDRLHQKPCGSCETPAIALMDEINSLKDQIQNLKDVLCCTEEDKLQLQEEYQNKLNLINDLKMELEDWKSNCEKTLQRNDYLEKYTESFREQVQKLVDENRSLSHDLQENSSAIDNLMNVINNKSQEVDKLRNDVEHKSKENSLLHEKIHSLHDAFNKSVSALDTEKSLTLKSLHIAKQESQELIERFKDYDDIVQKQDSLTQMYQKQTEEYNRLKSLLSSTQHEKKALEMDIVSLENKNAILLQEIQRLHDINNYAVNNITTLQEQKNQYKLSLELTQKDSKILQEKMYNLEELTSQLQQLKESNEKLISENNSLQEQLANKTIELDKAIHKIQLTKKDSAELEYKLQNAESLKSDYTAIDDAYKKLVKEQQHLQFEFDEKKRSFDNLLESFNNLKNKLEKVNDKTSEEFESLSMELSSLKKMYRELLAEKNILQNDYDDKSEEINNLHNVLEGKIEANRVLSQQLKQLARNHESVRDAMNSLQDENFTTKNAYEALRKESDELMERVKYCEWLESEYNELKKEHDLVVNERNKLEIELDMQIAKMKKIEKDNAELNTESQVLLSHSEDLEKALINARTKLIDNANNTPNLDMDIIKEIEDMRREKLSNNICIRDLLDKLDELENIIASLNEDISTRDYKIAMLQNHINELKSEVERLHVSLEEIMDTSEELKDNSFKRIRESLNSMEAHHSKATHNMKMELAKLQDENLKLEERLSVTKLKSDDSTRDIRKYVSQISNLKNEREIIVTDIKQLELNSVGDSVLSPKNCDIEQVLRSLDRIRHYLDAKSSKSESLEQRLLQVQNSVQSKADEAKKIVEKEKQKILNEKEEAIRDRKCMENQLADLKEKLEKQLSHDKTVITDLEAEILNQKLIFDKLKDSTQSYISKLKGELQSLEELYEKSIQNISDLENKLQLSTEEKSTYLGTIQKVHIQLEEKVHEINMLKKELEALTNKSINSVGTQVVTVEMKNKETQTIEFQYEGPNKYEYNEEIKKNDDNEFKKSTAYEKKTMQKDKLKHINEVQVLTANVEPTYDYVRNSYLNYKLKVLSIGRTEQCSIPSSSENGNEPDCEIYMEPDTYQSTENMNVIDIYNKRSMHTNSSKVFDGNYPDNGRDMKSPDLKTSAITDFGQTMESFDTKSSDHKASNLFGSVSGVSTDKDLFFIYKDSETYNASKPYDKKSWPPNGHSELLDEGAPKHPDKETKPSKKRHKGVKERKVENDKKIYPEDDELIEDDSVKHKLKIKLPRIDNDTPTIDTGSNFDKKSLDSYNMNIFSEPKRTFSSSDHKMEKGKKTIDKILRQPSVHSLSNEETQYYEPHGFTVKEKLMKSLNKKRVAGIINASNDYSPSVSIRKNELSNENISPSSSTFVKHRYDNDSRHELSRIDADVGLIKTKIDHGDTAYKKKKGKPENVEPQINKTYNTTNFIRKTHSDELFKTIKLHGKSDSYPSGLSDQQKFTALSKDPSSFSPTKTYTEQSIMVKLDPIEEYEKKISFLTSNLENIEKDYKKKIEAIKRQYDSNIKSILNEHNEGVKSIQGLHEETLQDIIRNHENEVENLRSMSIDAMKKADKLEKEVRSLKGKVPVGSMSCLDEEPVKVSTERKRKFNMGSITLTQTGVEAFYLKPNKSNGPCTCTLDFNVSDTVRNMFEQFDVEQRKNAESVYLKYIINKIIKSAVEALDCQELCFLHLKVCRIWKRKLSKEESLKKRIDALEEELLTKQQQNKQDMIDLDRKVAEERRRLQEAREAVCKVSTCSRYDSLGTEADFVPSLSAPIEDVDFFCNTGSYSMNVGERQSAGDLGPALNAGVRPKRVRHESHRAVHSKMVEDRRERRQSYDEPPTRLRRQYDRQSTRSHKK